MKQIFTLVLIVLFSASAFSQGDTTKPKPSATPKTNTAIRPASALPTDTIFVTKYYVSLQPCVMNTDGTVSKTGTPVLIEKGVQFYKDRVTTDGQNKFTGYVIHFREYEMKHPYYRPKKHKQYLENNKKYVYDLSQTEFSRGKSTDGVKKDFPKTTKTQFFLLTEADLAYTDTAKTIQTGVTFTNFNIQSLPAKMRFGSNRTLHYPDDNLPYRRRFDITSGINLGAAFGPKFNIDKKHGNNYISIIAGFSIGSVSIDSSTTDNKCGTSKLALGLTPYGGILYEYQKFQVGFFLGFDFLTGDIGRNWNYRNQPWFGIGIGYSLFGAVNTTNGQTGK